MRTEVISLTFNFTILLILANLAICHDCGHRKVQSRITPQSIDLKVEDSYADSIVDGGSSHEFIIELDFTHSDQFISSNTNFQQLYSQAKAHLEGVRLYFQKSMRVKGAAEKRESKTDIECEGNTIAAFTAKTVDLIITIQAENNPDAGYFAAAAICYSDSDTNRPTVGIYFLNFAGMEADKINDFYNFATMAHEFTHILGFNDLFYDKFVDAENKVIPKDKVIGQSTINGVTYSTVIMPEVVQFAREYFGCPSLEGVPLENGGGSGSAYSHWEKLYLPEEYMNPTTAYPATISLFTQKFLNSTGWYIVDPRTAQPYDWGRLDGCNHFNPSGCPLGQEYCSASSPKYSCTVDFMAFSTCSGDADFFGGNCMATIGAAMAHCTIGRSPYIDGTIYDRGFDEFGAHSRCFMATSSADSIDYLPACLKAACSGSKVLVKSPTTGDIKTCNSDTEILDISIDNTKTIKVQCPVASDFCTDFANRCPLDCSSHGMCMLGRTCYCFPGYSGDDCGICDGCVSEKDPFVISYKSVPEVNTDPFPQSSDPFSQYESTNISNSTSSRNRYPQIMLHAVSMVIVFVLGK